MYLIKCVFCGNEQQWQRSCAEQSIPKACNFCRRNIIMTQHNILSMKNQIKKLKDVRKGVEIANKMRQIYQQMIEGQEFVSPTVYW